MTGARFIEEADSRPTVTIYMAIKGRSHPQPAQFEWDEAVQFLAEYNTFLRTGACDRRMFIVYEGMVCIDWAEVQMVIVNSKSPDVVSRLYEEATDSSR
jgi:hypothetical protein